MDDIRNILKRFSETINTRCNNNVTEPASIFVCYSHRDSLWRDKIENYFKENQPSLSIQYFDDTRIQAGTAWSLEIKKKIDTTSIAILLVSDNYFKSRYIIKTELPYIRELYERHKLDRILPIWIGGALPERHWLAHLQFLTAQKGPLENADEIEFKSVMKSLIGNLSEASS